MTHYLLSRAGSLRLTLVPQLTRSFVNRAAQRPVPPHGNHAGSTEEFLATIGRGAPEKLKAESWENLWAMDGHAMKDMGVPVRDRRYFLWCMEKYRASNGLWKPDQIVHEMKPRKKIRGHGPAVQNGKRIRSRRDR